MSRPSRFHSLFAPLRRSFSSRSPSTPQRSRAARAVRLRLECLEERRVLAASWLGQIGGFGEELGSFLQVMDSAGNMYLNGRFQQTVDFDPGAGVTSLTSAGGNDGFVAKYALDGSLQWARRFGGSSTENFADKVNSVAVDPTPTRPFVYATGNFLGSADFTGDGVPDATAVGENDVFLVKLDAATGQTVWFKTLGSAYQDEGNDVVTDGDSVYVAGSFRGTADIDPGPNSVTLTPAGSGNLNTQRESDAFVWKLDATGNYAAAWQFGGTYVVDGFPTDVGQSLALDGSDLYLQGTFAGTVDFDLGPGVQSRTSVSRTDTFIARYTTAGALTWVQAVGSVWFDTDFRMTADAGSLYLTGTLEGAIDFDPGPGIVRLAVTSQDVAMAKYAKADGSLAWARQFGGDRNEYGGVRCITDPTTGAVYFGMNSLSPTIDINPGMPGGEFTNTTSDGNADGFLVKLDADGNYLNAWQVGGPGYEGSPRPLGLINGTLYVTGSFYQTANFPTGGTLTSNGDRDLYLMAFADPAAQPLAQVVGRRVFYNNSGWDGNNAAAGASDDNAIAPDKAALLPGQTATMANYTSFSKGLSGVMIDVANLAGSITVGDFSFKTGNVDDTTTWTKLATAPSISLRPGAGTDGSTRITLTWPDGTIKKQWPQLTMLSGAAMGLPADDVFYFGNAVGEAGNSATDAQVNAGEELLARGNPRNIANPAAITFLYDYNRDKLVNAADQLLSRANGTKLATALTLIVPAPAVSPAAAALVDAAMVVDSDGGDPLDILVKHLRKRRRR